VLTTFCIRRPGVVRAADEERKQAALQCYPKEEANDHEGI
jgi:hypothetical protein